VGELIQKLAAVNSFEDDKRRCWYTLNILSAVHAMQIWSMPELR